MRQCIVWFGFLAFFTLSHGWRKLDGSVGVKSVEKALFLFWGDLGGFLLVCFVFYYLAQQHIGRLERARAGQQRADVRAGMGGAGSVFRTTTLRPKSLAASGATLVN